MTDGPEVLVSDWQRRFFAVLEDFFQRLHGCGTDTVHPTSDYPTWAKTQISTMARTGQAAYEYLCDHLEPLHAEAADINIISLASQMGGLKLVLGGTSRFMESQLTAVKKMALYADTVLIPDPILPWFEVPRAEERFGKVLMVQSIYTLLKLKPLVDADLPYPPIAVFPSWEKTLELRDEQTIVNQQALVTGVLSDQLGQSFESYDELGEFARDHSDSFLDSVSERNLFIAPGGAIGDPFTDAIQAYREDVMTWRSQEFQDQLLRLPDAALVLNGVTERIAPLYHLLENAEEVAANPLVALPAHWHYYRLCVRYFESRLDNLELLDKQTIAEIEGLQATTFNWLGDVPIDALVELRADGENEHFRSRMRDFTGSLQGVPLQDINRVAGEISRALLGLVQEHQTEIKEIQRRYDRKHIKTGVLAGVTTAAIFMPTLAPLVGGLPLLVPAGKFTWDLVSKHFDMKDASQSLMGILATTREQA